jgi:quercetin dioxygenase-like cupin family protein
MKFRFVLVAVGVMLPLALAQSGRGVPKEIGIADEPHHSLLLRNDKVSVFRLKLQPNEATLPHRHEGFYVYMGMREVSIGNEVRGHAPVAVQLVPGEVHTSKGGFTVAERDNSSGPADIVVIEPTSSSGPGFGSPIADFAFHDAGSIELFTNSMVRGYSIGMAVGGKIDRHKESFDRLIIAVTDLNLSETDEAGIRTDLQMKVGDVRWLPKGTIHDVANLGQSKAGFVTLEFN